MAYIKKSLRKGSEKKDDFDFFKKIKTGNKYADSGKKIEPRDIIDTGSYAFNVLYSGSMNEGFATNKTYMLAGEKQVGKTFFAIHSFCKPLSDKGYFIFYIDTEGSLTDKQLTDEFGLPENQIRIIQEEVVENLRFTLNDIVEQIENSMGNRLQNDKKCAIVIDSQGQLDTLKNRKDTAAHKDTSDLSLQKELKKMYKTVTTRLSRLNIPMLITNHVYTDNLNFIKQVVISGGQGAHYATSTMIHLRKKQFVENKVRKGTIITGKLVKSRNCVEGRECSVYLNFDHGLNKWYGIHLFAKEAELIDTWTESKYEKTDVQSPEKPGKYTWYVIKDPKKKESDWIVCKEKDLFKKETIGTIFDEINNWVNKAYKLTRPVDFSYDDGSDDSDNLDIDENSVKEISE